MIDRFSRLHMDSMELVRTLPSATCFLSRCLTVLCSVYLSAMLRLHHAYYDGLVAMRAATLAFHPATNERFISLDYGLEKLGVKLIERGTESMAQISRSLVGHV